jgi:pilus assembly protein CpaE
MMDQTVENDTEILIAGRSSQGIERLQRTLMQNLNSQRIAMRHISNGHSNPLYGITATPDILVFLLSEIGEEEISSLLETPADSRPATIIIGPADDVGCMKMAMKAGVTDYIEQPLSEDELLAAVERLAGQTRSNPRHPEGQMMAVVSAKGGSGASFLAANLAHVMASAEMRRVALIDLDLQFGSLAQYLDLEPEHGFMPALDMAEHLDETAANAYMAKHSSGLSLLSPLEDEIILSRDVPLEHFGRLLDLLKKAYDRIVIDLPRQIDELSAEVYERSDRILLVTQQEIASVRDARRLSTLIRNELSIPAERISIVINRYDKNSIVELDDIARSLKVDKEDMIIVPNSYRSVAESINVGVPMFDHSRNSPVTKALMKMNARLQGTDINAHPSTMKRMFSELLGG